MDDVDELKRRLAQGRITHVDLDDVSRHIDQAAAGLDLELCPPDVAQRAGFAKPAESITVAYDQCPER